MTFTIATTKRQWTLGFMHAIPLQTVSVRQWRDSRLFLEIAVESGGLREVQPFADFANHHVGVL